jgi:processive 1,2-diacylglycerol beta-glucosyltransferase
VPREKISVTGIPVMPQFGTTLDRATCARELGIDPRKFTVLMMAGGGGVGALDELAERLLREPRELQLVALAGRNEALLKRLQALAKKNPGRLFPQGFTTTVERIMTAADLVITKPGGLSTSECLALRKPMLLVSPIPGQEERNADYLLEAGAAVKAVDAATLDYKLGRLLAEPAKLAAMSEAARRIGTPAAARDLVGLLSSSR